MKERAQAVLVLEDGKVFYGKAIGNEGRTAGEIVFNTAMTGYQEIFTDPSSHGQIIAMASAHIGNYGVASIDAESDVIRCAGIVVKKISEVTSRKLAESSLQELLEKSNKIGISDVDTRALVAHVRNHGSMNAIISTEQGVSVDELLEEVKKTPKMEELELANEISTKEILKFPVSTGAVKHKTALIDFGSVRNIASYLNSLGCEVIVYPMTTPLNRILEDKPDGFILSNGPGNPSKMSSSIALTKEIINANLPVMGINMGHLLIALSQELEIVKLKSGRRGANHPVLNHLTGKGEITTQNHSFVVVRESAESNNDIEITHSHLNDGTVAGIALKNKDVFSVQFHPEPSVGPHDSFYLFDQLIEKMDNNKKK